MHVLWRQGTLAIEGAGPARLAYNSQHLAYIREYYLYCVDLFAQAFERYGRAVDLTFGNYGVNFGAKRPSLRIDIQHEHTLVKPGGRDSAGAPLGTIPLPDGSGNYLVRLAGYAYLKTLDTVIEYSRPNLVNLRDCGFFNDYLSRVAHVAPVLFDMQLASGDRDIAVLSLIYDLAQPRRKRFYEVAHGAGMPIGNVRNVFDKQGLCRLYDRTRILVNLRQTDHHDTLEELRVLPALLRGVIVVSEDVPLRKTIPYHRSIVWTDYAGLVDTVRDVHRDYERYHRMLFGDGAFTAVVAEMLESNRADVDAAVRRMLCL
jgi:hypothetical protein